VGRRRGRSRHPVFPFKAKIVAEGDFGPTNGAQSVRDGAGPQAVSDPGGGVSFTTLASLSAAINANPAGTKFVHAAGGTESWSGGLLIPAGKRPKIYFLGLAGSTATTLTGGGVVIGFDCLVGTGAGAEIRGGTYTGFGTLAGIKDQRVFIGRGAFVAEDCKFDTCYGATGYDGTGATGLETNRLTRCYAVNSMNYAFSSGSGAITAPGMEVSHCHWKNSNTGHFDTGWDSGGTKFLANDAWVHHCWAEDNYGSGIWFDFSGNDVICEENVCENNTAWGIFYEMGGGPSGASATGIIRHNYLYNNSTGSSGWFDGQLLASCDDGLREGGGGFYIHNNLIDAPASNTAVSLGFIDHDSHPHDVKGARFHDNDVWLRSTSVGRVGGDVGTGGGQPQGDPFSAGHDNHFTNNTYHVTDTALAKWRWAGLNRTWAQWQAYGHDQTGSLVLI
jgi:hypothetical protein